LVRLLDIDVLTKEVLSWEGLHLFHAPMSSCSQKVRIYLNVKGIDWVSHPVNLGAGENLTPYYLGVNPRGLVPTLVHDGAVHIESNDIILHLEKAFPAPSLVPDAYQDDLVTLLRHEDDLHMSLRILSFGFAFAPKGPVKSQQALEQYATAGSGTVRGQKDPNLANEIAFWEDQARQGITDDQIKDAAARFRNAFDDLEKRLAAGNFLLGDGMSVLDIAWFVYVARLSVAGYPFARLHPRVLAWYERLRTNPSLANETALPEPLAARVATIRAAQMESGRTLEAVALG
jgi:glutathione S-transferase